MSRPGGFQLGAPAEQLGVFAAVAVGALAAWTALAHGVFAGTFPAVAVLVLGTYYFALVGSRLTARHVSERRTCVAALVRWCFLLPRCTTAEKARPERTEAGGNITERREIT